MAKHRLNKPSALSVGARRALIIGAVSAGTVALATAPASADSITVEGVGTFDLPEGIAIPDVPEVSALEDAAGNLPQGIEAPQVTIDRDGGPAEAAPAPVPGPEHRVVTAAESKVGSPYVWGATGPDAFDCSGLVQWAFAQAGISLPRTTYQQASAGVEIPVEDLRPGDIVLYNGNNHIGIYVGGGQIVHAATTGTPVKYAPLHLMRISAARRV